MAIKFQYNKTALQQLYKQLEIRVRALPTIKNKESALRVEVKKAKDRMLELEKKLKEKISQYDYMSRLWVEFDASIVGIDNVRLSAKKIAGVKTPVLDGIDFYTVKFSIFNKPKWYLDGVALIKEIASIAIEKEVFNKKTQLVDRARKKTTQKVNLYEKVQIPGFEEAILKIKRFMEDEENLSKSAQKIVKNRQQQLELVQ
jgi:V/A-type H+-transporting ATPase subunit D